MPQWPPKKWSWNMLHAPPKSLVPKNLAQIFWQVRKTPNSSWLICLSLRYRESLDIFSSHTSSSRGSHQPVFDLSQLTRLVSSDSSGLNGYQRLEITCLKSGSNQYEATPSLFLGGFKLLFFGGENISHQICLLIFWGWSYPYLGDEHPLGLSLLILCNVRIDQHPGILVSFTGSLNSLTCIRCWYYSRANI